MPAPMPVPTVISIACCWSRAAPSFASAQAAAFASFSTTTGRPIRSSTRFFTCSSRQARLGANNTVERVSSTKPAAPMPTAMTSCRPCSSSTTSAMTSAVSSGRAAGVARFTFSTIFPRSSTTPAATLVPPTSTPIVRLIRPFRLLVPLLRGIAGGLVRSLRRRLRPLAGDPRSVRRGPAVPRCLPVLAIGRPRIRWRRLGLAARPGQHRVHGAERVLDRGRDSVPCRRQMIADTRARVTHAPGRPADRAPLALRRFPYPQRYLRGSSVPDIAGVIAAAAAEGPADLAGDFLAHRLGAVTQQPALEIAQHVRAGRHLARPGLASLAASALSPRPVLASPVPALTVPVRPLRYLVRDGFVSTVTLGLGPGCLRPDRFVLARPAGVLPAWVAALIRHDLTAPARRGPGVSRPAPSGP